MWQSRTSDGGHVIALAWSAPRGLIAAASVDGPICLFDAQTGQLRQTLSGHGFGTSSVDWSADGHYLASGGQDGKVRLWNLPSSALRPQDSVQSTEMMGGAAWVERVAWCPTTNILASAAGKKLRLWNESGGIREYPDHPSTIADLRWKPNDTILASAGYGKLFLWSPQQQPPVREFAWQGSMLVLAWSPDGKYIAAGAQDASVHFWLMATGEDLQMTGYPTKVRELSWDHTGRYLATGGGPTPCVWDCSGKGPADTQPLQFDAHKDNVTSLAFQHRGPMLASAGEDGLVALWQPGKQLGALALARHDSPVSQILWSADDQRLAVGTAEGDICLYSIK
jgi:WD40 repeat protein